MTAKLVSRKALLAIVWIAALVGRSSAQAPPDGIIVHDSSLTLHVLVRDVIGCPACSFKPNLAGLTIDEENRVLYAADSIAFPEGGLAGPSLYRIPLEPEPIFQRVTNNFDPPGTDGFYSWNGSDLQFARGSVFVRLTDGHLVEISLESGIAEVYMTVPPGFESGLAHIGDRLFLTRGDDLGDGTPDLIEIDLVEESRRTVTRGLPRGASTLEYDPVHEIGYFAFSDGKEFRRVDLESGDHELVHTSSRANGHGNFTVGPQGNFLYHRRGSLIERIDLNSDEVFDVVTNIPFHSSATAPGADLVFGPSSTGEGVSLYFGNKANVYELAGFRRPEANTGSIDLIEVRRVEDETVLTWESTEGMLYDMQVFDVTTKEYMTVKANVPGEPGSTTSATAETSSQSTRIYRVIQP